jgi:hypothetical protein
MEDDRRKFERVACYMIAQRTSRGPEEEDFFGIVRNISPGGAMIEADHPVDVGSILDLAFLLDKERQIWEGRGRVVWSRLKEGKTIFGLQFTQPLEENWERALR